MKTYEVKTVVSAEVELSCEVSCEVGSEAVKRFETHLKGVLAGLFRQELLSIRLIRVLHGSHCFSVEEKP
jgi:hypothetical protein